MSLYSRRIFPRLCHWVMADGRLGEARRRALEPAAGEVVEIGFGTGLNLAHYPAAVERVAGVDPNPGMHRLARPAVEAARGEGLAVELHTAPAERLPFPDARFDCAVSTWTLCSIGDVEAALAEIRRVLKPGGRLLFLEHGLSHEPRVARWQRRLTPLQKRLADGCHLDRDAEALIATAGFAIPAAERFYLPWAPKLVGYLYRGVALRERPP